MDEQMPNDRKYNLDHSWIKLEGDIAIVGVTKVFMDSIKELAFIELPKPGPIKAGDTYLSLESVKWSGHVSSPVTGEVIEVNKGLFDEPSKLNKEPYEEWIMKVRLSQQPKGLLSAEEAIAKSTCPI